MAFDPLSDSTRKYRAAAIGVAAALIAVQAFHISIEKLPVAGIEIKLADKLLPVALTVSLIYVTISFAIYLIDDLVNMSSALFLEEKAKALANQSQQFKDELRQLVIFLTQGLEAEEATKISEKIQPLLLDPNPDFTHKFSTRRRLNSDQDQSSIHAIEHINEFLFAADTLMKPSSLKRYRRFRAFRLCVLEAALPLILAAIALSAVISAAVSGWLQHILAG